MTKRRSGEAQAAQRRTSAGPMKHRLEPRGGARNEYAELMEDVNTELALDISVEMVELRNLLDQALIMLDHAAHGLATHGMPKFAAHLQNERERLANEAQAITRGSDKEAK